MNRDNIRSVANVMLISMIVILAAFFLLTALTKFIESDEMETLTAASFIFDGKVPYRDFWQMHTPFSYYFFAPLFLFFKTMKIFYAARLLVYALLILNGYLLFTIAGYLFSRRIAVFSFLSYLVSMPVLYRMTEIRPDVLVVFFSNLSLLFLLWNKLPAKKSFFLAGIFSALAFLSKQSGIIFIFGIIIFFIFRALTERSRFWDNELFSKKRFNAGNYSFFLGGFLVPCVIFIFLLWSQGAFKPFLRYAVNNDFLRGALLLKSEGMPSLPNKFLMRIPLINFMLFVSLIISFFYIYLKKEYIVKFANAYLFIFILFFVSFISLFFILRAWEQDFLLFFQYFALLSAVMLCFFYDYIYNYCSARNMKPLGVILDAGILIMLCLPHLFRPHAITGKGFWRLHRQIGSFDRIISSTNKDDRCLSITYPCPFRPSVYFYRLTTPNFESPIAIKHIEKSLIDEILHNDIVVFVPFEKVCHFPVFLPNLTRVIEDNYIYEGYFYVPGKILRAADGRAPEFNIIVHGYYRIPDNTGGMRIDGELPKTDIVYLKEGRHTAYLPDPRDYRVIYDLKANKKQVQ